MCRRSAALPHSSLIADGEFLHVIERAIVDVEVNISLYAGKPPYIGVLPEFPRPLVFHLVNIVVGYPIRIVVEYGSIEVFLLEFVVVIYDMLHMILVFYVV